MSSLVSTSRSRARYGLTLIEVLASLVLLSLITAAAMQLIAVLVKRPAAHPSFARPAPAWMLRAERVLLSDGDRLAALASNGALVLDADTVGGRAGTKLFAGLHRATDESSGTPALLALNATDEETGESWFHSVFVDPDLFDTSIEGEASR